LNVNSTHVGTHPLFEDIYQESAVLFAPHLAFRYQVSGLCVKHSLLSGLLAPAQVGDLNCLRGGPLDNRNELHPFGMQLIAKEAIDCAAVMLIGGVDSTQNIEIDAVFAQLPPALHHPVEGSVPAAVDSVGVVDFARAIYAQTDQEIVFLEESAPVVIEKDAISLEGVLHHLSRSSLLLHDFDVAFEDIELQ